MLLEKQLIMTIGMTCNNWELTREMVENSLDSFSNRPIVYNKEQGFRDYSKENRQQYEALSIIGIIADNPNIVIENNKVYADILIFDEKYGDKWHGQFDNWCVQINDDWTKFQLVSIEVF